MLPELEGKQQEEETADENKRSSGSLSTLVARYDLIRYYGRTVYLIHSTHTSLRSVCMLIQLAQ